MKTSNTSRVCIAAVMRMEQPYIVEWVAWHKLLGFELVVADNGGPDGQSELLVRLAAHGLIRVIDFRDFSILPQIPAYHAMFHWALSEGYDYAGFLDADEFFDPIGYYDDGAGADLVRSLFAQTGKAIMSFNWMCFGSSGRLRYSPEPVMARFTEAAEQSATPNHHVKSFVDLRQCERIIGERNMCRHFNPHGLVVGDENFSHDGWAYETGIGFGITRDVRWRHARIRHYVVKSRQEYQDRKAARGRADVIRAGQYDDTFLKRHDLNDFDAPLPAAALARLDAEMSRISHMTPVPPRPFRARWAELSAGLTEVTLVENAVDTFIAAHTEQLPDACRIMRADLDRYVRRRLPLPFWAARAAARAFTRRPA